MSKPFIGFVLFVTHHQQLHQNLAARFWAKMEGICFLIVHYSPDEQHFVVNTGRSSPIVAAGLSGQWSLELFVERIQPLKQLADKFCVIADANLGEVGGSKVSLVLKALYDALSPHHVSLFTATEACQGEALSWLTDTNQSYEGESISLDLIEQCRGLARKAGFSLVSFDSQGSTPTPTPNPLLQEREEKPTMPVVREKITLTLPQHVHAAEKRPEDSRETVLSSHVRVEPAARSFWAPLSHFCGMLFCCCKRREAVIAPLDTTSQTIETITKGKVIP